MGEPRSLRALFRKGGVETILYLYSKENATYSNIKKQGFVVGDRSLSRLLKILCNEGLVERKVLPTFPVGVSYSLTVKGRAVAEHLSEIRKILA